MKLTRHLGAGTLVAAALSLVVSGCGDVSSDDDDFESSSAAVVSLSKLEAMRPYWEQIAPWCAGHPSKEHCDDGDMTLFSGLLCAAGEADACEAVRLAQGPDGRFWRSPRRVGGNLGKPKSFSRDMTMGVLLYLATTRDKAAAERWMDWIDDNRACAVKKPFGMGCLVRAPHRVCRDDESMACTITPGLWALMGRVWQHLGLPRHAEMKRWDGYDGDIATLEATFTEPGYQQHLKGVAIFLKERLGVSRSWRETNAQILLDSQPENPFFRYLREGASSAVVARLEAVCPRPETHATARRFQWSWERADASEAWRESMGWDCVFMLDVLKRAPR